MSRRPNPLGDGPNVIQFRPRAKPPKAPARWARSLKLFAILLVVVGALRALYAGVGFSWTDLLFVVLLAGVVAFGDYRARRT